MNGDALRLKNKKQKLWKNMPHQEVQMSTQNL